MNSNNGKDARDSKLSSLYQAGEQLEPPPDFDDQILAAARKEVRAGPRRAARTGLSPWLIPLSTAAVLVLTVSMVTLMRHEQPEQFDPDRVAVLEIPSEDSIAGRSTAAPAGVRIKPLTAQESAALGKADSVPSESEQLKSREAMEPQRRKMEEERKMLEPERPGPDTAASNEEFQQQAAKQIELELRKQVEQERRREAELRMRAEAEMRMHAERLRRQQEEARLSQLADGAPETAEPGESAPGATAPGIAKSASGDAVPTAPETPLANIAPPLPQKIFDNADDWLKEIARLRHVGEKELAADQLRQFRQRYPEMPEADIELKIEKFTKALN